MGDDIKANGIKPEEWSKLMNDETIETSFKRKQVGLPEIDHHVDDNSRQKEADIASDETVEESDNIESSSCWNMC